MNVVTQIYTSNLCCYTNYVHIAISSYTYKYTVEVRSSDILRLCIGVTVFMMTSFLLSARESSSPLRNFRRGSSSGGKRIQAPRGTFEVIRWRVCSKGGTQKLKEDLKLQIWFAIFIFSLTYFLDSHTLPKRPRDVRGDVLSN